MSPSPIHIGILTGLFLFFFFPRAGRLFLNSRGTQVLVVCFFFWSPTEWAPLTWLKCENPWVLEREGQTGPRSTLRAEGEAAQAGSEARPQTTAGLCPGGEHCTGAHMLCLQTTPVLPLCLCVTEAVLLFAWLWGFVNICQVQMATFCKVKITWARKKNIAIFTHILHIYICNW